MDLKSQGEFGHVNQQTTLRSFRIKLKFYSFFILEI